jgi:hypothetical protein
MIRISPAFDFNAERRKDGSQTALFGKQRGGGASAAEAAGGNRPFTMTPEWPFQAQGTERKSRLRPPRASPLSVRLSGL